MHTAISEPAGLWTKPSYHLVNAAIVDIRGPGLGEVLKFAMGIGR
ncbi:MAG: hypothetical protein ACU0CA_01460 [Paracoccaceae bacterium]